jgi:hypothetical protein
MVAMPTAPAETTIVHAFKKCPRCGYSLQGLSANHACPECGLRFGEPCELYPLANPKHVRLIWFTLFFQGVSAVCAFLSVTRSSTAPMWKILACVMTLVVPPYYWWRMIGRYRQAYEVAVTIDGLIVRLPGRNDNLIPWKNIGGASVKERPKNKPQIATVFLKDKRTHISIGGMWNVFPTRADVERFIGQVKAHIAPAGDGDTSQQGGGNTGHPAQRKSALSHLRGAALGTIR